MWLRRDCFITLLSGLLDNDTPHCKVGKGKKKPGRKNRFLVAILKLFMPQESRKIRGMNVQTLKTLLFPNTCGVWDDIFLMERQKGRNALALGGKDEGPCTFSSATRSSISWGISPTLQLTWESNTAFFANDADKHFPCRKHFLCVNLGQEGVFPWMTVQ